MIRDPQGCAKCATSGSLRCEHFVLMIIVANVRNSILYKFRSSDLMFLNHLLAVKNIYILVQVYLTFIEVNFEFTEGESKRVKSLLVRFTSVVHICPTAIPHSLRICAHE